MRGNSLVLIDSKFRGKTISYLPALCSLLHMHLDNVYNGEQMGAYIIILCPNSSSVEKTAYLCRHLLVTNNFRAPKVVHSIGTRSIPSVAVSHHQFVFFFFSFYQNFSIFQNELLSGCNVFVTTMTCLLGLLEYNEKILTNKHIAFVFDNIDMLDNQYGVEKLQLIFKTFCTSNQKNTKQVIITSRTWYSNIRQIIPHIKNVALIIGNFLEAAIYGNLKTKLILRNENKADSIIGKFLIYKIKSRNLFVQSDMNETAVNDDSFKVLPMTNHLVKKTRVYLRKCQNVSKFLCKTQVFFTGHR